MKIWIDDVRPAPPGYHHCRSVNEAIELIQYTEAVLGFRLDVQVREYVKIALLDLDHDAGDYAKDGGDYIKLLDWLESTGRSYPIRIHSMNPVGVENMRRIIQRNGWEEIS